MTPLNSTPPRKPDYEYRVTFAEVPEDFPAHGQLAEQLSRVCPRPPKGEGWQLVCAVSVRSLIFYNWERPAQGA